MSCRTTDLHSQSYQLDPENFNQFGGIHMCCFNTSKNAPADRREYIDKLYQDYKEACRLGDKKTKMEIKLKLQAEHVNSYDYYSKSSLIAFLIGMGLIAAIITFVILT